MADEPTSTYRNLNPNTPVHAPLSPTVAAMVAAIAYEVNCEYRRAIGEAPLPAWDALPPERQNGYCVAVTSHYDNPNIVPEDNHAAWLAQREEQGWSYGKVEDLDKKKHPNMVPYDKLPPEQRAKDYIFRAIVQSVLRRAVFSAGGYPGA